MDIDPRTYPSRAFIRFTAQNQLRADLTGQSFTTSVKRADGETYVQQVNPSDLAEPISEIPEERIIDEALFEEIAEITCSANRYPELYHSCGTRQAAKALETQVAAEMVAAYLQIKLKQRCPIVARLNALL